MLDPFGIDLSVAVTLAASAFRSRLDISRGTGAAGPGASDSLLRSRTSSLSQTLYRLFRRAGVGDSSVMRGTADVPCSSANAPLPLVTASLPAKATFHGSATLSALSSWARDSPSATPRKAGLGVALNQMSPKVRPSDRSFSSSDAPPMWLWSMWVTMNRSIWRFPCRFARSFARRAFNAG